MGTGFQLLISRILLSGKRHSAGLTSDRWCKCKVGGRQSEKPVSVKSMNNFNFVKSNGSLGSFNRDGKPGSRTPAEEKRVLSLVTEEESVLLTWPCIFPCRSWSKTSDGWGLRGYISRQGWGSHYSYQQPSSPGVNYTTLSFNSHVNMRNIWDGLWARFH